MSRQDDRSAGPARPNEPSGGVPWNKVAALRWPLSAYYADLKARQYIRAFVRAGGSEAERATRGRVIDHWLVDRKVSSVDVVSAIKKVKADR